MIRNPAMKRLNNLFAGFDADAFTLPADVVAARTRAERTKAELAKPDRAPRAPAVRAEIRDAVLDAIDRGDELPDPTPIVEADVYDRAVGELQAMLNEIAERAEDSVVARVQRNGEVIIVEHLRPAVADVMEQVIACAAALAGYDIADPEAIMTAPIKVRDAYRELRGLADRYRHIRMAQAIVGDVAGGARVDVQGTFSELRNLPDVHPNYARPGAPKPWPDDERGRLLWLATSDAQVWMPTPYEQDEALLARFPRHFNSRSRGGQRVDVADYWPDYEPVA